MHRFITHRFRYQLIALGGLIGFALVAGLVAAELTLGVDESVLYAVHRFDTAWLTTGLKLFTLLGDPASQIVVGLVVATLLVYVRQWRKALIVALLLSGSGLLVSLLKTVFDRARPELWPRPAYEASFSFPSGHAAASLMICIVILYAIPAAWRNRTVLSVMVAYILVIGFSRLYLGVHYPTDVIAGWLVSLGWAGLILAIVRSARIT